MSLTKEKPQAKPKKNDPCPVCGDPMKKIVSTAFEGRDLGPSCSFICGKVLHLEARIERLESLITK